MNASQLHPEPLYFIRAFKLGGEVGQVDVVCDRKQDGEVMGANLLGHLGDKGFGQHHDASPLGAQKRDFRLDA